MKRQLVELAKKVAFRHTRFGAPSYPYNLEPIELATLIVESDRLRAVPGTILEVGVARGMTTRFLCEHFRTSGYSGRFAVVDTFNSFPPEHLEHEVRQRGKRRGDLQAFRFSEFRSWTRNFSQFPSVVAYQADCATFDYGRLGPIKLALLDVDLYLPTKAALPAIYAQLTPGGVLLVDDVAPNSVWDGAYQAYHEFCDEMGLRPEVVGNKGGLLRK